MSATRTPAGDGPSNDGFVLTPNDSIVQASTCRAVYVGSSGNITGVTVGGTVLTFVSVPQGTILPIRFTQVFASNTTAANLIGLI